jgi:predicted MFS family arabinose efflux permease
MSALTVRSGQRSALYWLALGTFAIGTEGFMIAGLLPDISADLGVSVQAAGQLVTIFALTYAVSSPILTAISGNVDRRRLLAMAMGAFAAANVVAFESAGYWGLVGARVLLALAAGLFVPAANALASTLVPTRFRGRALAVVNGGTTIAIALGVPLGALLGNRFGWRMTFAAVAMISVAATAGLIVGLPRGIGAAPNCITVRQRLAVARQPAVMVALLMTTLWATGSYTLYTYLATVIRHDLAGSNAAVSCALFIWGSCAAGGVWIGGRLNDAIGSTEVIFPALFTSAIALFALSGVIAIVPNSHALLPGMLAIGVWGAAAWAVHPAQMARLISLAGATAATIVLSLNASFLYFGFAAGAAIGAVVMALGTSADLGWVGGIAQVMAVWLIVSNRAASGNAGRGASRDDADAALVTAIPAAQDPTR